MKSVLVELYKTSCYSIKQTFRKQRYLCNMSFMDGEQRQKRAQHEQMRL